MFQLGSNSSAYLSGGIFLTRVRLGEQVDEFGHVLEVFAHFGGQYHVDDALAQFLERGPLQSFEDVHPLVEQGQLEGQRRMVWLEDTNIIVQNGKFAASVAQEPTKMRIKRLNC